MRGARQFKASPFVRGCVFDEYLDPSHSPGPGISSFILWLKFGSVLTTLKSYGH